MSSRVLPYPLFDADNHLYEPPEAMTKYLPRRYEKAIQYVQIKGRTKIAVRGQISEYIPNPAFHDPAPRLEVIWPSSPRSSGWSGCCSVPTGRTPRASPTRSATWTSWPS
jgi:hypothetical protein